MGAMQRWAHSGFGQFNAGRWNTKLAGLPLAGAIGAVQIVGSFGAARGQPEREPLDAIAILLLVAGPALLTVRWRYPALVLTSVLAITLLYLVAGYPYGPVILSPIVAGYTAILAAQRIVAWIGAGALYISHMGYRALFADPPGWMELVGVAAWMLVILVGSEAIRAYKERAAESARVQREGELRRESEERVRIAQELHDVLAHHISLINVQAGVALHLMDQKPEQARTALAAIEAASREAISEVRSMVDILQRPGETAPREPAQGLDRLDSIREQAAAAGLDVRLETSGTPCPVSVAVNAAAYRIVQEAITNVIRHAAATTATVRLRYDENELAVEVKDNGTGGTSFRQGGSGIPGMRERAKALGGSFDAGSFPGGGFRVRATFPLQEAS